VLGRKRNKTTSNRVAASWLQLQKDEIKEIGMTIAEILSRLDLNHCVRGRLPPPPTVHYRSAGMHHTLPSRTCKPERRNEQPH
jgi:hypothetical protein